MNAQEIENLIINNGGVEKLVDGELDEIIPAYEIVDKKGDREGGGEYSMKVFHFKEANVFLKVTGFYSSYHGTDWNEEIEEVKPVEKTVTVYE
jgi:hypothetical protein